ncbi:hypothetical protein KZ829_03075 [Actinoplanes hulinensis]|uniref:Uncharacterized protein n=1 Tax=Actinoplanes hulinensis TaxID=1144547 RepID=A0ABS7AVE9_9ACTN|nr:hypothetical protein [Actinoplanes hulinensis]
MQAEPSSEDLAAIEAEWPLIEAEMLLVAAEIAWAIAAERGGPSPMDWKRLRRAESQVVRVAAELARTVTTPVAPAGRKAVA